MKQENKEILKDKNAYQGKDPMQQNKEEQGQNFDRREGEASEIDNPVNPVIVNENEQKKADQQKKKELEVEH